MKHIIESALAIAVVGGMSILTLGCFALPVMLIFIG